MKCRALWLFAAAILAGVSLSAAVHRFDSMYVGGTAAGLVEDTAGLTHTSDAKVFTFEYKSGKLVVPYERITSIEYGETLGHHGASSMAGAALVAGSAGVLAVRLAKRRRHYLTLGYLDDSQQPQVAVFELGKDRIYPTLYNLRTKTGKKLEFQDEESRNEIMRLTP